MFFRSLRKMVFVVPMIAALALTGCFGSSGDDEFRNEQITKLLNEGKTLLAKNQWGLAKETFERVLTDYDGANSEARFGIVLADLLSFTDTIRLISSLTDSFSAASSAEENRFVNQLITDLIHDLRSKFETIDKNLLLVVANPGFRFNINDLPIYLSSGDEPSENLKGEWDRADAFLLTALVKGVLGALNYADSIDLQLDVLRAYDYFSQSAFNTDRLDHLESLITYVLNDPNYPNFLSVKPDGGNELVAKAGNDFSLAVRNFQIALYMASLETDDQKDDIFQYVDENGNNQYDPPLDPESDKCDHLARVLEAGEKDHTAPENFSIFGSTLGSTDDMPFLSEQTACLLQKLYHNLAWDEVKDLDATKELGYTAAPRINFAGDLLPLISSIASGIIQDNKDSLPDEVASIVGLATAPVIEDIVNGIIGNSLEFDLHAFFSTDDSDRAGNLRGLLPAWQNAACAGTGICLNDFVIEMECRGNAGPLPIALTDLYVDLEAPVCKKSWIDAALPFTDSTHFDADEATLASFDMEPIDADGIKSRLPYIAFQDASFHGVLYLNLAGLAENHDDDVKEALLNLDGGAKDFARASLLDFNAFLAAISNDGTLAIAFNAVE